MTNYREKCHVRGCPCGEFSSKSPSDASDHEQIARVGEFENGLSNPSQTPRNATSDDRSAQNPSSGADYLSDASEGLNRQGTQNRAIPVSDNEQGNADNTAKEGETPKIDFYEYLKTFKYAPEVHPTHVIDEHEQRIRMCVNCRKAVPELDQPCAVTPDSPALRRGRSILHHAEMVEERKRAQLTFEQEWQSAPKSIKHGCEEASAEFFYHAGRRDRETEMLREVNEVLSGIVGRIEQERVR